MNVKEIGATIYAVFEPSDRELIEPYLKQLSNTGHEVITTKATTDIAALTQIFEATIRKADVILIFTTHGLLYNTELPYIHLLQGEAFINRKGKTFIQIVFPDIQTPYRTENTIFLTLENMDPEAVVSSVNAMIREENSKAKETIAPTSKTVKRTASKAPLEQTLKAPNFTTETSLQTEEIKDIQNFLKKEGFFQSVVDGKMGPATTEAISRYQQQHGLIVSGEWDGDTAATAKLFLGTKSTSENISTPGTDNALKYWVHIRSVSSFANGKGKYNWIDDYITDAGRIPKEGEKGIAISNENGISLLCFFEIEGVNRLIKGIKKNTDNSYEVIQNFTPPIELPHHLNPTQSDAWADAMLSLLGDKWFIELSASRYAEIEAYANSYTATEAVQQTVMDNMGNEVAPPPRTVFQKPTISAIAADTATGPIKDALGFEADVNALAAVMAYKEVKPPLAIGLFGNWGSGKSFFMNKLRLRIDELAKETGELFCNNVLQINFNSWHYSDANLWASLITKLFEELDNYGKSRPDELKALFENLNSTKEILQQTELEKAGADVAIAKLQEELQQCKDDLDKKAAQLKGIKPKDIITALGQNTDIKAKWQQLKNEYAFLQLEEFDTIKNNIATIEGAVQQTKQSIGILYLLRHPNTLFALALFVLTIIGVPILIDFIPWVKQHLAGYKFLIGTISTVLVQLIAYIKPAINTISKVHQVLGSVKTTVDELREKAIKENEAALLAKQQEIDLMVAKSNALQQQILDWQQKKQQLETAISDIVSGKKIINFIEGRVADERYNKSLGIVSWIRKDFEELDFLLKQQHDANLLAATGRKKVEKVFQLERIILYIDDLDRCNEAIVVKVLEAIHLLLAFPLFVVVVGVDPRWIHQSLNNQYEHLLDTDFSGQDDTPKQTGKTATSFDYLEKIFQIPFALKPMNKAGKDKLIEAQLGSSVISFRVKEQRLAGESKTDNNNIPITGEQTTVIPPVATGEPVALPNTLTPTVPLPTATAPETLQVSQQEMDFMQQISSLIGESPRTIKRYINMYRILRTHAVFEVMRHSSEHEYNAAMIQLAIITGSPHLAKTLFDQIEKSIETDTLQTHFNNPAIKAEAEMLANLLLSAGTGIGDAFTQIPMQSFKRNSHLISRFSFRQLEE